MGKIIKIWLMSQHWYWATKYRLNRLGFLFEAGLYKQVEAGNRAKSNLSIFRTISRLSFKNLIIVVFSIAILHAIEAIITKKFGLIKALSPEDKDYYLDQVRMYAQILASIFSIYFATIGIILSAGHAKLRRDIIWLLTSEQVGSNYSKVLVFSASFCVAATAVPIFGIAPGYLVYSAATLLTLLTSLTLFPLGQRLFTFFDLNPLIRSEILPKIAKHIEAACNPRISISIANHHSLQARRLFEQMTYIDDRMKSEVASWETSLPDLTGDYTALLIYYLNNKPRIDPTSYWFPRKRRHKQWFYAGDSATGMALRTSTQLEPEEKADLDWLETEIIDRLKNHVEIAANAQRYDLALKLLGRTSARIEVYADGFHFDIGMREITALRRVIEDSLFREGSQPQGVHKSDLIYLCDTWAALGGNLCLESMRRMITFEKELAVFFKNDDWTAEAMRKLPGFLQVEVAFIGRRLEFELEIEGRRLSRPKYLQQLLVQSLLKNYAKVLPEACEFHHKQVPDFAKLLVSNGFTAAATQILLANLHSHWKLPRWLGDVSALIDRYARYQHYTDKPYQFESIDIAAVLKLIVSARDDVVSLFCGPEIVQYIIRYRHEDEIPDHFGHVYYMLAEECINALAKNDLKKTKEILIVFVALSTIADLRFSKENIEMSMEYRLHLISSVIQDLSSVIGYSLLYGEYHGNTELRDFAKSCFWGHVEKFEDKNAYLNRLLRLSDARSISWAASPRDIIRTEWRMAFERQAQEDGYLDAFSLGSSAVHPSELVNEFLRSHSEASDLFLALEVVPSVGKLDFEVSYNIRNFADKLAANKRDMGEVDEAP